MKQKKENKDPGGGWNPGRKTKATKDQRQKEFQEQFSQFAEHWSYFPA